MRYTLPLLILGLLSSSDGLGQPPVPSSPATVSQSTATTHEATDRLRDLPLLSTVKATYVNAGMLLNPLKCDTNGNLYLRTLVDGVSAIHKLSAGGEHIAVFEPDLATPDFKRVTGAYFSVGREGYVYQMVGVWDIRKNHVFIYRPDGNLKSYTKLETSFPWTPAQVAAFPSGNFLVILEFRRLWCRPRV